MSMPMEPVHQGPIDFDTLMALRNQARERQQGSLQGAASRRLEQRSQQPDVMPQEGQSSNAVLDGKSPDELVVEDIQREEEESIEPPDITQSAAQTMMRYGAIQRYLMAARGELPDG